MPQVVNVATKPAWESAWSVAHRVSEPGEQVFSPHVAVALEGRAAVVWKRHRTGSALGGSSFTVQAVTGNASGVGWRRQRNIGIEADPPVYPGDQPAPRVALDARGAGAAIWPGARDGEQVLESASVTARGVWSAPEVLSPVDEGHFADVAVSQSGTVLAAWQGADGRHSRVAAAEKPVSEAWRPPDQLSPRQPANDVDPSVAIDGFGNAAVIWTRFPDGQVGASTSVSDVEIATRAAGADSWQAPLRLSVAGESAADPSLSFDSRGNAVALWHQAGEQGDRVVRAATYTTPSPGPAPPRLARLRVTPDDIRLPGRRRAGRRMSADLRFSLSGAARIRVTLLREQRISHGTRRMWIGAFTSRYLAPGLHLVRLAGRLAPVNLRSGAYLVRVVGQSSRSYTHAAYTRFRVTRR